MTTDFAHLHVHSTGSLLDGLSRSKDAVAAIAADGQRHIAVTDHGGLSMTMAFAQAAEAAGVVSIPGIELYLAIGDRHERNHVIVPAEEDFDGSGGSEGGGKRKIYEHLTVLALNSVGWRNLVRLDWASRQTFYGKPRADYALLAEHHDGLVVGTGCLGGPVAGPLMRGDRATAEANAGTLVQIYGRENIFVEVMDHGIPAERKVIPGLVDLARRFGLQVVATNDSHYTQDCESGAHDAWLAIGESREEKTVLVTDEKRFRFSGSGYHLRTGREMADLFDGQPGTEKAVSNTLLIAERAEPRIVLDSVPNRHRMPNYVVPEGFTSVNHYFHERFRQGLIERYGLPLPREVRDQARYEEDVLVSFGVCGYMLVKADILAGARAKGIVVGPGRGSAVGSLAAYALRITNVEPIGAGLRFERFLNPERASLPDIDSDFPASRQVEVMQDVRDAYGQEYVARIGTFGQDWARGSLRKVGRVTNQASLADRLARLVPDGRVEENTLALLMEDANPAGAPLREVCAAQPDAAELVSAAMALEGNISYESTHACGLVIGDEPLADVIPLRLEKPSDPNSFPITAWPAGQVEASEHIKYDILALKDLDVVATAVDLIASTTGERVDVDSLVPSEVSQRADRAWAMLAAGRTAGVFQLASSGISELTMSVRPHSHDDLAAILALYRPGPMGGGMHDLFVARRAGQSTIDYGIFTADPSEQASIANVLDETMGLIFYQEQLMDLGREVADFTAGQRNFLQKAVSKKKKDMLEASYRDWIAQGQKDIRSDGTPKVAFRRETLDKVWRVFEASGDYLFNKSHAFGYAMTTWMMAYLKANWPTQFGAALLANTGRDGKRIKVMRDLHTEGIEIVPPDINVASAHTTITPTGAIMLGLSEIKGVGDESNRLVAQREEHGPYTSVTDLWSRTGVSSTTMTALAEAGSLDALGPRLGICMASRAMKAQPHIPDAEWGTVERAARQRMRLGVVVGEHPFTVVRAQLDTWREDALRGAPLREVTDVPPVRGADVNIAGIVAAVTEKNTARGPRAFITLESDRGDIEVALWPDVYGPYRRGHGTPSVGSVMAVSGSVRTFIPTSSGDDELAPADPVVSVTAYRVHTPALHDPARRPQAAPGAVTVLSLAPLDERVAAHTVQAAAAPDPDDEDEPPQADVETEQVTHVVGDLHLKVRVTPHRICTVSGQLMGRLRRELSRIFPEIESLPPLSKSAVAGDPVAVLHSSVIPGVRLHITVADILDTSEISAWIAGTQHRGAVA